MVNATKNRGKHMNYASKEENDIFENGIKLIVLILFVLSVTLPLFVFINGKILPTAAKELSIILFFGFPLLAYTWFSFCDKEV